MERVIVSCRHTGMGARTHTEVLREPVEIRVFNRSRRGNHWEEEVSIGEGGIAFVVDISNSGKHRCYLLGTSMSLEEAEEQFGELPLDLEPDKEKLWEEAYRRAGDDEELAERIFDEIHFDEIGRLYEEAEERVRWLFGELGIHPVYLDLGDWDVHLEIRLSDEDRERLRSILETSK